MLDPSDFSTCRKRTLEEEAAKDGSNKHQHTSRSVHQGTDINSHVKDTDACASQTFVMENNRLITDSIPNHVRRHNAEIAQQGNILQAVLNAHTGLERQLRQHDEQLSETKQAIQEAAAHAVSNKAQDEIAQLGEKVTRIDEQWKHELAEFKDMIIKRLETIERKADQTAQTLPNLGRYLQGLGPIPEQTTGEGHAASVQDYHVIVDAQKESIELHEPQSSTAASRSTPASNPEAPVSITPKNYFEWLANFDFLPPMGMVRYEKEMEDITFNEIHLVDMDSASNNPIKYFVVRNSTGISITKKIPAANAHGIDDNHVTRSPHEQSYLTHIAELRRDQCEEFNKMHGRRPPCYVLPLGHLFVRDPKKGSRSVWTGFHLVMDITSPLKSLWLVLGEKSTALNEENQTSQSATYESLFVESSDNQPAEPVKSEESESADLHDIQPAQPQFSSRFPGIPTKTEFDLIRFAPSVDVMHKKASKMWKLRYLVKKDMSDNEWKCDPVLAVPDFDDLMEKMKDGYKKHKNRPLSTPLIK